jgi:anti-anti-sigma regulatory factor
MRAAASEAGGAVGCAISSGYASGWLSGLFDADLLAREQCCAAQGAARCAFEARTPSAWTASGDAEAAADVARLPFAPLRDLVARHLATQVAANEASGQGFEGGAPVIHVWGPVMVIPFSGADETLSGLELIRRDAGAKGVRVVVVDLAGAIIDESFGALQLERVLEAVEQLRAEPILTGISPLSERVVASLESAHLIVRKDLPEAIAAAFQIADAMRRAL